MDTKVTECDSVAWSNLAENGIQLQDLVNIPLNIWIP